MESFSSIGLQYRAAVWAAAVALLFVTLPAHAQPIESGTVRIDGSEIRIMGAIDRTVANLFVQLVAANPGLDTVSLDSPGGYVIPALDMARVVNAKGLKTTVPGGDGCHSSCSLIFLAGKERVADGQLGVHQISGVDDPSLTQTVISEIYEELVRFNTPSYLVSRMLRTPPDEIYIFSPEELERNSINVRAGEGSEIPHLLAVETWMRKDWLVGVFMNTHVNAPFIALESREMDPLMRIVHYPHRQQTFIEFMLQEGELSGTTTRMEMRFEHGNDQPHSLFVDADIDTNSYSFDMPTHPDDIRMFWAAFSTATRLVVLNGFGIEIGSYSLAGSRQASEDFATIASR